ncbi:MAG TPA: 6,7-dimethyl-8-ribityllumazine synthase [Armatimonadota bacterium]|jgi:6,7-dimethyl-8-ribityllumazine synthase
MRHYENTTGEGVTAEGLRIAVAASRYNRDVTDALLNGALSALREAGAAEADVTVVRVPGAFELPLALQALLNTGMFDAAVALGAVVRGGTPHFDFVAQGCMQGLMRVSLDSGIPIGFGVLTTDNQAQALERSRPDEANKGREAALTAVEMALCVRPVQPIAEGAEA